MAIPTSVGVWYGRGDADTRDVDRTDRPLVNGVRLSGGTHWDNPQKWRSFKPQLSVNTRVATNRFTSTSAPERTAERAAVIVLALLGHYMQHPRRPALQRRAGEFAAARRLRELGRAEARIGEQIVEKRQQIGRLEVQLADYVRLEGELRELAESYARRIEANQAGGRA